MKLIYALLLLWAPSAFSAQESNSYQALYSASQNLAKISCRFAFEKSNNHLARVLEFFSQGKEPGTSTFAYLDYFFSGKSDLQTLDSSDAIHTDLERRTQALLQLSSSAPSSWTRATDFLFADWSSEIGAFLNTTQNVLDLFESQKESIESGRLPNRIDFALTEEELRRDEEYIERAWKEGKGPGPGSRTSRWARPSAYRWSNYPYLVQTGSYKIKEVSFEGLRSLLPESIQSWLEPFEDPDKLQIERVEAEASDRSASRLLLHFYRGDTLLITIGMFKTDQSDAEEESFAMVEMDVDIDSFPLSFRLLTIDSKNLKISTGFQEWSLESLQD